MLKSARRGGKRSSESLRTYARAPNGNGCAERFIRPLKENLLWMQTFETIGLPQAQISLPTRRLG